MANAIKFTPGFTAGGKMGEVEVRTEMVSETHTHHVIKISVRDTGIGIPESAQSKLFDRFSQAGGSLRASTRPTSNLLFLIHASV